MLQVVLLRPIVFIAIFASLAWSVPALRAAERDRIDAFLSVTGFDVALDSIALAAGDAPQMLGLDADDFGSDWTAMSSAVFDTKRMHQMALDILVDTLGDQQLAHAAEFYASPLGQRLVEAENASHLVEDDAAKRQDGLAIVAQGVADNDPRIALLQELGQAVDADGNSVRAVQEIQVRFLLAASYAGILDVELDEDALRAAMKEDEARLRNSLRAAGLASAAYTYQGFSEAELRAYVKALNHPDMQQVYQLLNAVQYEIMANRFEVLAARMAELHPGQEL